MKALKKYFWSDGDKQYGPFTIDELKPEVIKRETLIWLEGLKDWKSADDVPELKPILESPPQKEGFLIRVFKFITNRLNVR